MPTVTTDPDGTVWYSIGNTQITPAPPGTTTWRHRIGTVIQVQPDQKTYRYVGNATLKPIWAVFDYGPLSPMWLINHSWRPYGPEGLEASL